MCKPDMCIFEPRIDSRSLRPPRTYLHNLNCQQLIRNCRPGILIIFQLTHSLSSNAVDTLISPWSRPHPHTHSFMRQLFICLRAHSSELSKDVPKLQLSVLSSKVGIPHKLQLRNIAH